MPGDRTSPQTFATATGTPPGSVLTPDPGISLSVGFGEGNFPAIGRDRNWPGSDLPSCMFGPEDQSHGRRHFIRYSLIFLPCPAALPGRCGFYTVDQNERAVKTNFGPSRTASPEPQRSHPRPTYLRESEMTRRKTALPSNPQVRVIS